MHSNERGPEPDDPEAAVRFLTFGSVAGVVRDDRQAVLPMPLPMMEEDDA